VGPDNLANVFVVLKQILKRRGMTYESLAETLGASEGAIKNMFSRSTCTLERLAEICQCLGISLGDLFKTAEAHSSELLILTEEQEQHFADYPDTFLFFRACFYDELTPREVKRRWRLTDQKLEKYLRTMEDLGLAERHPEQRLQFLVRGKLQWRLRGPWVQEHLPAIAALATERVLAKPDSYYSLGFLTLTEEQLSGFKTELETVVKKYRDIAARDYLVRDQLPQKPMSWLFSMVPGDICVEVVSDR
jgi:transcriptional regulator with XRE-family HTH domain